LNAREHRGRWLRRQLPESDRQQAEKNQETRRHGV
jgi:hypothetical protein